VQRVLEYFIFRKALRLFELRKCLHRADLVVIDDGELAEWFLPVWRDLHRRIGVAC
jgi:hypothetical protein